MMNLSANGSSWLARIGAALALGLAVVAGLALSAFFFGFFLILAALVAIWLGWQRWRIRKHLRKNPPSTGQAVIIQGEYEVIEEAKSTRSRASNNTAPTDQAHNRTAGRSG